VRALLLTDISQQPVGHGVAGRSLVEIVDLVVLGRLARRQQPVDRRNSGLQPQPQRQANAARVRDLDL
jgi:hypothetical protein